MTAQRDSCLARAPRGPRARRPGPSRPRALRRSRSEEHTSELQSRVDLVCRLLLEKKKKDKLGRFGFPVRSCQLKTVRPACRIRISGIGDCRFDDAPAFLEDNQTCLLHICAAQIIKT